MRTSIYDRISAKRILEEQRLEQERLMQETLDVPPPPPERFHTNELSFVRPTVLKDKTFHVFTKTDIGPSPFSLVVGRSAIEEGADLETLAQQLLGELKKSLSHLEWIEPATPIHVAGLDALRVEFRWREQGQPVHQLQLIFIHQDEHKHGLLMQITGTSNNPKGMALEEWQTFDSLIDSLELRHAPDADPDAEEKAPA